MFPGIVAELGALESIESHGDSARIRFRGAVVTADVGHGHSIAVNGVCLTVTGFMVGEYFDTDVMAETLDRSALGALGPGDPVNLERAMRADARFGGHIVQGHVDGTGIGLDRTEHEKWHVVRISLPDDLGRYVVQQGSMTVSGAAPTSSAVSPVDHPEPWFEFSLIPATLDATTLGGLTPGDPVNLEVDVLAKYVERLIDGRGDRPA